MLTGGFRGGKEKRNGYSIWHDAMKVGQVESGKQESPRERRGSSLKIGDMCGGKKHNRR